MNLHKSKFVRLKKKYFGLVWVALLLLAFGSQAEEQGEIVETNDSLSMPDSVEPDKPREIVESKNVSPSTTLESEYTLGRITGGGVLNNRILATNIDGMTFLYNQLFAQVGREDKFQVGLYVDAGMAFAADGFALPAGIPAFRWACEPSQSHRISLDLLSNALYGALFVPGGLYPIRPNSYFWQGSLKWDFLSRNGEIRIDPEMYEINFFCGPQINAGQFGFRTGAEISILENEYGDNHVSYRTALAVNSNSAADLYMLPVIGILDNLQLSVKAALPRAVYSYDYGNNEFYNGGAPYGLQCSFRLPKIQISQQWLLNEVYHSSVYGNEKSLYENNFITEFFFIHGEQITSESQVAGNWNGFFSDQLGLLQIVSASRLHVFIEDKQVPTFYFSPTNSLDFSEILHIGIHKNISTGMKYAFRIPIDQHSPVHDLAIDATIYNTPLREQEPSTVSKFEYVFGYLPKPKEYKIKVAYKFLRSNAVDLVSLRAAPVSNMQALNGNNFYFDNIGPNSFGEKIEDYYDFSFKGMFGTGILPDSRTFVQAAVGISQQYLYQDFLDYSYPYDSDTTYSGKVIFFTANLAYTIPNIPKHSAISFGVAVNGNSGISSRRIGESFVYNLFFNYSRAL